MIAVQRQRVWVFARVCRGLQGFSLGANLRVGAGTQRLQARWYSVFASLGSYNGVGPVEDTFSILYVLCFSFGDNQQGPGLGVAEVPYCTTLIVGVSSGEGVIVGVASDEAAIMCHPFKGDHLSPAVSHGLVVGF